MCGKCFILLIFVMGFSTFGYAESENISASSQAMEFNRDIRLFQWLATELNKKNLNPKITAIMRNSLTDEGDQYAFWQVYEKPKRREKFHPLARGFIVGSKRYFTKIEVESFDPLVLKVNDKKTVKIDSKNVVESIKKSFRKGKFESTVRFSFLQSAWAEEHLAPDVARTFMVATAVSRTAEFIMKFEEEFKKVGILDQIRRESIVCTREGLKGSIDLISSGDKIRYDFEIDPQHKALDKYTIYTGEKKTEIHSGWNIDNSQTEACEKFSPEKWQNLTGDDKQALVQKMLGTSTFLMNKKKRECVIKVDTSAPLGKYMASHCDFYEGLQNGYLMPECLSVSCSSSLSKSRQSKLESEFPDQPAESFAIKNLLFGYNCEGMKFVSPTYCTGPETACNNPGAARKSLETALGMRGGIEEFTEESINYSKAYIEAQEWVSRFNEGEGNPDRKYRASNCQLYTGVGLKCFLERVSDDVSFKNKIVFPRQFEKRMNELNKPIAESYRKMKTTLESMEKEKSLGAERMDNFQMQTQYLRSLATCCEDSSCANSLKEFSKIKLKTQGEPKTSNDTKSTPPQFGRGSH